jgi:ABC-type multidrug transport system fused ATPase/permease subunit
VSFFDTTPKDVIMTRFNDDINNLNYIIGNIYWMSQDGFYFITTLFYVTQANWILALGVIPFFVMCRNMLTKSSITFKAMIKSFEKYRRDMQTDAGEIVSGGNSIRAFGTEEYAIENNLNNKDIMNLCYVVNIATFQYISIKCRQASVILVILGCANVLMNKKNPEADIVMTTVIMQRMIDLGCRLLSVIHRISHQERELLNV